MKPQSYGHHRLLLHYEDIAPPYSAAPASPPSSPPEILHPGRGPGDGYSSSSLPPLFPPPSDAPAATTSRHTLRRPQPIMRPPLAPDPPFGSSMALTILVLLGALFFMGFFSIYIRRFAAADDSSSSTSMHFPRGSRRYSQASVPSRLPTYSRASSSYAPRGLDLDTIRSLPSYDYDGGAKYQIDCPVCLSEFEEGETVKVIPRCEHVFHVQCIDRWLQSHVSCPVCRATQLLLQVRPSCKPGPTVDSCLPPAATEVEGTSGSSASPPFAADAGSHPGEPEASSTREVVAMMRCHSWSHVDVGQEESSGDRRRMTVYRTSSF